MEYRTAIRGVVCNVGLGEGQAAKEGLRSDASGQRGVVTAAAYKATRRANKLGTPEAHHAAAAMHAKAATSGENSGYQTAQHKKLAAAHTASAASPRPHTVS